MNQVLERIGIYDVVAVLFSGMIITLFSDFIDVVFLNSKYQLCNYIKINETIPFLAISYFIGIIFQEVSSFFQKRVTHKNA